MNAARPTAPLQASEQYLSVLCVSSQNLRAGVNEPGALDRPVARLPLLPRPSCELKLSQPLTKQSLNPPLDLRAPARVPKEIVFGEPNDFPRKTRSKWLTQDPAPRGGGVFAFRPIPTAPFALAARAAALSVSRAVARRPRATPRVAVDELQQPFQTLKLPG